MVVCRYWLEGNCRFGSSCWFDHFKPEDAPVRSEFQNLLEKEVEEQEEELGRMYNYDEYYCSDDSGDAVKIRNALLHGKSLYDEEEDETEDEEEEDEEDEEEDEEDEEEEEDYEKACNYSDDEEDEDEDSDEEENSDEEYERKARHRRKMRKLNNSKRLKQSINITDVTPPIIIRHPTYDFTKWLNTLVLQNIFMYLPTSDKLSFRLVHAAFTNELYIGYNSHLHHLKYQFQLYLLFKNLIKSNLDKYSTKLSTMQFINGCILHLNAHILNNQLMSNDTNHSIEMNDYLSSNDANLIAIKNYKQLFKDGNVKFTSWASVKLDHSQGSVCELSIKRKDGNGFVKLFQHHLKTIFSRDETCHVYYYLATRKENKMETLILTDTYNADKVIHDKDALNDVFSSLDIPPNWNLNDFITFLMICSCSFYIHINDFSEKEYAIVDILQLLQVQDSTFNLLSSNNSKKNNTNNTNNTINTNYGDSSDDEVDSIHKNRHTHSELNGIRCMENLVNDISQSNQFNDSHYLKSIIDLRNFCLNYSGKLIKLEDDFQSKSKTERKLKMKQLLDNRKGFSVYISSQVLEEKKIYSECNFKTKSNEILNVILEVTSFSGYHYNSFSVKIIKNKTDQIKWKGMYL